MKGMRSRLRCAAKLAQARVVKEAFVRNTSAPCSPLELRRSGSRTMWRLWCVRHFFVLFWELRLSFSTLSLWDVMYFFFLLFCFVVKRTAFSTKYSKSPLLLSFLSVFFFFLRVCQPSDLVRLQGFQWLYSFCVCSLLPFLSLLLFVFTVCGQLAAAFFPLFFFFVCFVNSLTSIFWARFNSPCVRASQCQARVHGRAKSW